jgi:hypothetical protein
MSVRVIPAVSLALALTVLTFLPSHLDATSMIKFSDRDLAIEADAIIQGTVTSTWTDWGENSRYIYTYGTVAVDRVIKGSVDGDEVMVKRPGGSIGDTRMEVYGTADVQKGQEVLLFLLDDMTYESNVLGWEQGRLNITDGVIEQNGEKVEDYIAKIQSFILNEE